MPGASDLAGYKCSLPKRRIDCGLPLTPTGSASRTRFFSRLNTQPALSPVNASPSGLPHATHDSGSLWLARPLTFETFIQYNLPVYTGAQEFKSWIDALSKEQFQVYLDRLRLLTRTL